MIGPPQGMIDFTPAMTRGWIEMNDAGIMNAMSYFIFDGFMTRDVYVQQTQLLSLALEKDAGAVMRGLLDGDRDFGNIGDYRYYVAQRQPPFKLVFLRCENEFSSMRSLLHDSILVGLLFFLLVFLLVILLSRRAMRPYEENIDNQKRFISNASHELKTPLGVIMSDIDMQVLESGQSEWLENAQLQADHLALLIEQLTSYALLGETHGSIASAPVDLSALAESLAGEFHPLAAANGQSMTVDIEPGVFASGSGDAFRTLFSVLLENALKYTPVGGMIRLSVRSGSRAVLESENTCGSIDPATLDRLFERFYRAPEHRAQQSGSGLGLSIAREITEMFGGTIRARSTEAGTLVFTAEFPPAKTEK